MGAGPPARRLLLVETMRAIRKLAAAPGLELVEIPVPVPADDEALVRVEAASGASGLR